MPEDFQNIPDLAGAPATEPEDIFGEFDVPAPAPQAPGAPAPVPPVSPLRPVYRPAAPPPVAPVTPQMPLPAPPKRSFGWLKKALIICGILIVAGGAVAAGVYYLPKVITFAKPKAANVNAANVSRPVNINRPVNVNQPVTAPINANVNAAPAAPVVNVNASPPPPPDADRDGLTDAEEALYGTDPNKADTDADGLTDRDEVKVFKTDPNNQDTDGDSYLDGEEVTHGYDPKGPGKLLKIQ